MKRKFLTLTLALLTCILFALPVSAAEYGVIYTESDYLQSDELTQLGQVELPAFTDTSGIDMRVDVLTSLFDYETVADAAAGIYDNYEYGYGPGRNGMTMTLLVHEDDTGVVLDDWYIYAAGDSDELVTNGPWNVIYELGDLMSGESWNGDAAQDSQTLAAAVKVMVNGMENFVRGGGTDTAAPGDNSTITTGPVIPDAPDSFPAAGETIGYVTDTAGLLTLSERQQLEQTAKNISDKHGFGVYLITVDSFRDHTDSYDVFDGAATLYNKYGLGVGEEKKGLLLLLSMNGRDFSLITYSDYGNYVFDQTTREGMTDWFLDNFGSDDWYGGFSDYLAVADEVLVEGPDKLSSEITGMTGMIFLIPLAIAAIGISILGRRMKSVAKAVEAQAYSGGLDLTRSHDRFTHATEVRRKRKEDSDDTRSGGGGLSSKSSGGFGGTSGKF